MVHHYGHIVSKLSLTVRVGKVCMRFEFAHAVPGVLMCGQEFVTTSVHTTPWRTAVVVHCRVAKVPFSQLAPAVYI